MDKQMDKIFGSIYGAALGDAMGAATETRSAEMIKEYFHGYVDELITPPDDCFARGCEAGNVTDDFSLAYFTAKELSRCNGKVDNELAKRAVLTWSEYPEFVRFAGPTTLNAIQKMKGIAAPGKNDYIACDNMKATNGSGMKIFSVGLINPGNPAKAVSDATVICMPTHPNSASIAGAAAIAAAVAVAVTPDATLDEVLDAGIAGAKQGFELGCENGIRVAVPSVEKRIRLAVEIARRGMGWEETMLELRDVIGAGLMAAEAIPCVFGILAANANDAFGAIRMGVNIGDDTDTVATMAGAVAGALYGVSNIPERFLEPINRVNHFDLSKLATDIYQAYYI